MLRICNHSIKRSYASSLISKSTVSKIGKRDIHSSSALNQTAQEEGIVKSLLYGSKEAQLDSAKIQQSWSKTLARGKYVHEIVYHKVAPNKVDEYIQEISKLYPKIKDDASNKVHLVGSWRTVIGEDADTFVHIWEYQGYKGYHETTDLLAKNAAVQKDVAKVNTLLQLKSNDIMQEFAFWPTASPRKLGGVFELRTYSLRPGHLLEWEAQWRTGLECRRQVMEPVGAWFTQVGKLNQVHHIWQFKNLEDRRNAREKCWQLEGWADTVRNTVPLVRDMTARIMIPLEFSPLS